MKLIFLMTFFTVCLSNAMDQVDLKDHDIAWFQDRIEDCKKHSYSTSCAVLAKYMNHLFEPACQTGFIHTEKKRAICQLLSDAMTDHKIAESVLSFQ